MLLLRLLRIKLDNDLMEPQGGNTTILSQKTMPDSTHDDPRLLLHLLQHGDQEEVKKVFEELKTKAVRSREQSDRAFYIKSASFYAIASGSLDLYRETTLCLRRFIRDQKTIKAVFNHAAINTKEGVKLLSGIPKKFSNLTPAQLSERVKEGNTIMLDLLDCHYIFERAILPFLGLARASSAFCRRCRTTREQSGQNQTSVQPIRG